MMMKFVLLLLLTVITMVASAEEKKSPWAKEIIRNRNKQQLRRAMIAVFDKAKEQVMKAESQSLQHMIIKEARSELFDAYDATVKNSCAGEDRSKDKKAIVKEAWKVLTDFLFRVDRLDFHNGCYTNDIGAFPSIIYE